MLINKDRLIPQKIMLKNYFKKLYQRTMAEAYGLASQQIFSSLKNDGSCLDCGAGSGHWFVKLSKEINLGISSYHGIEWDQESVQKAIWKKSTIPLFNL